MQLSDKGKEKIHEEIASCFAYSKSEGVPIAKYAFEEQLYIGGNAKYRYQLEDLHYALVYLARINSRIEDDAIGKSTVVKHLLLMHKLHQRRIRTSFRCHELAGQRHLVSV